MNFWNENNIKEAFGNVKTYNFPSDWNANGMIIWHENFEPGNMILVRSKGENKGVIPAGFNTIVNDCSAIITRNSAEYFKYNKPIIEYVGNNANVIINMARYIRKFFTGKVVGITGSSGKSTTTQMLVDIFSSKCKVSSNIYSKANTSWGIAWNMTRFGVDDDYWVIETSLGGGMSRNTALTKPDFAIVTNVAPVHITGTMELKDIAEEKSRIFNSMNEGSPAIIYRGMNYFDVVKGVAEYKGLKIITFGEEEDADIRIVSDNGTNKFIINGKEYTFGSDTVGRHILLDMAAALGVVKETDFPIEDAIEVLKNFKTLEGRGEEFEVVYPDNKSIVVVDESYNANPLSMAAAITAFGEKYPSYNKILVLGDMAECGPDSEKYHREISISIDKIKPSKILLCGKDIKYLYDEIKDKYDVKLYENIDDLYAEFENEISDGDYVMVKSSHSSNLYKIIEKLKGG